MLIVFHSLMKGYYVSILQHVSYSYYNIWYD